MKDSIKSAHATNWVNVPEKNKKSPIVPGKLLPASRVLWRSGHNGEKNFIALFYVSEHSEHFKSILKN